MPVTPLPARDQMAARNSGTASSRIAIPKMPYVPPPVNPREMPVWYEQFYREHSRWVEQMNQALVVKTVQT